MIRTALDSDDLSAFTTTTDFVLTYTDLVPDAAAFEARYPAQQVVYIDRKLGDPGTKASIIDIELGAFSVADIVPWFEERFHKGMRWLTHYSDRNDLPAILAELAGRNMWQWVATLDGTVHVDGYTPLFRPDIVQILGSDKLGIHADFSLVLNPGWRPSPESQQLTAAVNSLESANRGLAAASGELGRVTTLLKTLS